MKKTKIMLISLLMLQASSLGSLQAWEPEDDAAIAAETQGQRVISKRFVGFEGDPIHIPLEGLVPFGQLPANLGTVIPRVSCILENQQGQNQELLIPQKTLLGRWINQENRDEARNQATLVLEALVNNRLRHVRSFPILVNHELVRAGAPNQDLTQRFYNGYLPYPVTSAINTYRIPGTQTIYQRTIVNREGNLPGHDGQIVFCEPFAVADEVERDDYRGTYQFIRDLNPGEQLQNRNSGRLMYARDGQFYHVTVTQELWGNDRFQAGFFIASFLEKDSIKRLDGTQITNGNFDEGLYQMVSFSDRNNHRHEKWRKLRNKEGDELVDTVSPGLFFSMFGLGSGVPCIVPQVGTRDFNTLRQQINRVEQEVQRIRALYAEHNPQQVIVIGPTGSGKSTLITGLFRDLFAKKKNPEKRRSKLILSTNNPLPGFNIGNGVTAGTRLPSAWYDEENNVIYWDCPGFGDPAGYIQDIINAFLISKIFSDIPTKIVLNTNKGLLDLDTERAQGFFQLLDTIKSFFPEDQDLERCLSLIVSRSIDFDEPRELLDDLATEVEIAENPNENRLRFSPDGKRLLTFLHENPGRTSAFLAPQEEGPYFLNRGHIQECLARANFITPLTVNLLPNLTPGTREQCAEFAQNLNQYLVEYLRTKGSHELFVHYCLRQTSIHRGTSRALRTQFRGLRRDLRGLSHLTPEQIIEDPRAFSRVLEDKIDVSEINQTIDHINFLRRINPRVTYTPTAWFRALKRPLNKIQRLAQPPVVEVSQDGLSAFVKGIFLGSSDIQTAINAHPTCDINVFSGFSLYLDSNITHHGKNLMLSVPGSIYAWQPVTIDLSGRPGKKGDNGAFPGADGQPGKPGGSSGNLYTIVKGSLTGANHVTITLNGAQGGQGGNGAQGANGRNGRDGDLTKVSRIVPFNLGITYRINKYYVETSGNTYHYEDLGSPGSRGNCGGKKGSGGLGGLRGQLHGIEIEDVHLFNQDGVSGLKGAPGPGGKGGYSGQNCQGQIRRGTNIGKKKGKYIDQSPYYETLVPQAHVANNTRAPNGPEGKGVNITGRQGPEEVRIDVDELEGVVTQIWRDYYDAVAQDENAAPFIMF